MPLPINCSICHGAPGEHATPAGFAICSRRARDVFRAVVDTLGADEAQRLPDRTRDRGGAGRDDDQPGRGDSATDRLDRQLRGKLSPAEMNLVRTASRVRKEARRAGMSLTSSETTLSLTATALSNQALARARRQPVDMRRAAHAAVARLNGTAELAAARPAPPARAGTCRLVSNAELKAAAKEAAVRYGMA